MSMGGRWGIDGGDEPDETCETVRTSVLNVVSSARDDPQIDESTFGRVKVK